MEPYEVKPGVWVLPSGKKIKVKKASLKAIEEAAEKYKDVLKRLAQT